MPSVEFYQKFIPRIHHRFQERLVEPWTMQLMKMRHQYAVVTIHPRKGFTRSGTPSCNQSLQLISGGISLLVASQHRSILHVASCIALPHNHGHDEIAGVSDEEVIYTYSPAAVQQTNCQSYFNRQKNKKDGSWQQQQNSQY